MPIQQLPMFHRKLRACRDLDGVSLLLSEYIAPVGVRYFIFADLPEHNNFNRDNIRLSSLTAEWTQFYIGNKCVMCDPVIRYVRSSRKMFTWEEACSSRPLTSCEQEVMKAARSHNLINGLVIPFFRPAGFVTCVSFMNDGRNLSGGEKDYLYMLACATLYHLDELQGQCDGSADKFRSGRELSPKEIECLYLVSQGHNSKEIASHIGISPRTIDQYIGSASMKLNARNRTQAVIIAKERNVI